jgi:NAD(P)-dependent dehydrogenase (short-subunit alcohol dehydrogenase family)
MPQTTVIIGASRGIGLELVKQAAARGDRVIATVRRESDKAAPMEAGAARALLVDVTEPATLKAAAAELDGAVDLLICNAGVLNSYGGIQDSSHDRWAWQTVLMTNVAGPYFTVRAFLPLLERSDAAKVAILTSAMGAQLNAQGNAYPYRASKAGATNVARNLAVELASRKIAVGAYHPGWVRTDMGGEAADVGVEDAVEGLLLRLKALGPETTGAIEDYKGNPIPF